MGSVPVLSEDNVLEMRCEDIDGLDYGIAVFDGERAPWAEVSLDVDHQENVFIIDLKVSHTQNFTLTAIRNFLSNALNGCQRPKRDPCGA